MLAARRRRRPVIDPHPTPERVWDEVSEHVRATLSDTAWTTWFEGVRVVALDESSLTLATPNPFTRDWIGGHFLELIGAAARSVTGKELRILLIVSDGEAPSSAAIADAERPHRPAVEPAEPETGEGQWRANPKYTFDNFVIGSSNRFAHAAALAVAEAPGQAYNPFFVYGGTGLGKTHLLQAIAAYVSQHTRLTTRYVTCEAFTNDFINSLRQPGRIEGFKHRYRAYDVLLVDDVQFLEGKERIQEEFFHTFDSLVGAGKQVVLSSDRPPRDIATLEDRLKSRFEWGLLTEVQPPDLETRIAILRRKQAPGGSVIGDLDVLTAVASRVSTNIRELEGALNRVEAFARLGGLPLTVELAEQVLRDLFPDGGPQVAVTVERIQEMVCDRFGLTLAEMVSPRRNQALAFPRQIAMHLAREMTDSSLPKIGRAFGGRDHTTVMHATSKITRQMSEDRSVYNLVQDLTARIRNR